MLAGFPLGNADFEEVITELQKLKPDVVFNTINGDSNLYFFRALQEAGMNTLPLVSFSVDESSLKAFPSESNHLAHYAVWSYFQSLKTDANLRFVAALKNLYGAQRVTSGPIMSAYIGVHLWTNSVRQAKTDEPEEVRRAILQQSTSFLHLRPFPDYRPIRKWKSLLTEGFRVQP